MTTTTGFFGNDILVIRMTHTREATEQAYKFLRQMEDAHIDAYVNDDLLLFDGPSALWPDIPKPPGEVRAALIELIFLRAHDMRAEPRA